ncbi:hypothetical protein GCM10012319_66970 [Comamonas sp. KCTC 72670]|nr:hypothetical protein GCM10012319_66970 [Comamonas sp. KCTC 72670]
MYVIFRRTQYGIPRGAIPTRAVGMKTGDPSFAVSGGAAVRGARAGGLEGSWRVGRAAWGGMPRWGNLPPAARGGVWRLGGPGRKKFPQGPASQG